MINLNQNARFLVVDKTGRQKIVEGRDQSMDGECECTKFQGRGVEKKARNALFIDHEFQISEQDIHWLQQEFQEKIVLKRLCRLYPRQHKPPLFAEHPQRCVVSRKQRLPSFIYEMLLLGSSIFRNLILGRQISQDGCYSVLVNISGTYTLQIIDDFIPILQSTHQPIWSHVFNEPWHYVALKIWIKLQGGFSRLGKPKPFEFVQHFTQSNWKSFELATEGAYFLAHFKERVGKTCRILLKAKVSQKVGEAGLISGRVCYELMGVEQISGNTILVIRTIFENSWTGKMSIMDKALHLTDKMKETYKLGHTFTISHTDFLNLFSMGYVIHAHLPLPLYRSYYNFSKSANFRSARHFQITFAKEGVFNLSVLQPDAMSSSAEGKSKQQQERQQSSIRCMGVKYMLSRKATAPSSKIFLENAKQTSKIGSAIRSSMLHFEQKYNPLQYDFHTARNMQSSNNNANFLAIIPGIYILRIKADNTSSECNFTIHYSANQPAQMEQVFMTKEQSIDYLNQSIISLSCKLPHQALSKEKHQSFTLADQTDTLGYAFAALKVDKRSPYSVSMEVDPQKLRAEGYKLKNIYKKQTAKFSVMVNRGQAKAVVFKRDRDRKSHTWPSKAFRLTIQKDHQ